MNKWTSYVMIWIVATLTVCVCTYVTKSSWCVWLLLVLLLFELPDNNNKDV